MQLSPVHKSSKLFHLTFSSLKHTHGKKAVDTRGVGLAAAGRQQHKHTWCATSTTPIRPHRAPMPQLPPLARAGTVRLQPQGDPEDRGGRPREDTEDRGGRGYLVSESLPRACRGSLLVALSRRGREPTQQLPHTLHLSQRLPSSERFFLEDRC